MKRSKKTKIFVAALISCALISSSIVHAASALGGVLTGDHYITLLYGGTKNTTWTSCSDYSIPIYAEARYSNSPEDTRTSSVTTGYAEVWASSGPGSEYYAYGYHGYLYSGPRYFCSY